MIRNTHTWRAHTCRPRLHLPRLSLCCARALLPHPPLAASLATVGADLRAWGQAGTGACLVPAPGASQAAAAAWQALQVCVRVCARAYEHVCSTSASASVVPLAIPLSLVTLKQIPSFDECVHCKDECADCPAVRCLPQAYTQDCLPPHGPAALPAPTAHAHMRAHTCTLAHVYACTHTHLQAAWAACRQACLPSRSPSSCGCAATPQRPACESTAPTSSSLSPWPA